MIGYFRLSSPYIKDLYLNRSFCTECIDFANHRISWSLSAKSNSVQHCSASLSVLHVYLLHFHQFPAINPDLSFLWSAKCQTVLPSENCTVFKFAMNNINKEISPKNEKINDVFLLIKYICVRSLLTRANMTSSVSTNMMSSFFMSAF